MVTEWSDVATTDTLFLSYNFHNNNNNNNSLLSTSFRRYRAGKCSLFYEHAARSYLSESHINRNF